VLPSKVLLASTVITSLAKKASDKLVEVEKYLPLIGVVDESIAPAHTATQFIFTVIVNAEVGGVKVEICISAKLQLAKAVNCQTSPAITSQAIDIDCQLIQLNEALPQPHPPQTFIASHSSVQTLYKI
jgi:hypothetical protein